MPRRFLLAVPLLAMLVVLVGCGSGETSITESLVTTMADYEGIWICKMGTGESFKLEIAAEDDLYFGGEVSGYNEYGQFEGSEEIVGRLMANNQAVFLSGDGSDIIVTVMELRVNDELAWIALLIKDRYGYDYADRRGDEFIFHRR